MATYPITDEDVERFQNTFTYHRPTEEQAEKYETLRTIAKGFAFSILDLCPPSRERSVAITKLEEVVFWANASIARNETGE